MVLYYLFGNKDEDLVNEEPHQAKKEEETKETITIVEAGKGRNQSADVLIPILA